MKWTKRDGEWLHNGSPCRPVGGDYEEILADRDETINFLRRECDRKDDYIRKLEQGFARVEAGSWEETA